MKLQTHYHALLKLGIPIVIGQIGVIILGFADTLMIGHHSTPELAAASFVNNMFGLAIIFSTGFSYGLTPIVGSLFGQHKYEAAGQSLKNSIAANTVLAVMVCAVMYLLYLNMHRLGQPEELIPLMRPYFLILLASMPFVLWFNAFKQFTDGITDTRVSMWILLGGNILNIIGNYLLIYGKCGLPALGLNGAGLSTLIARILMVIAYLYLFFGTARYRLFHKGFLGGPAGMAHCRTNGNGNRFLQPQYHHGGLVRKYGFGLPPDYADHLTGLLHDVLRHGSCRIGTHQQLLRATRRRKCATDSYRRIPPDSGHDSCNLYPHLPAPASVRRLVHRQPAGQPHGGPTHHSIGYLPVR